MQNSCSNFMPIVSDGKAVTLLCDICAHLYAQETDMVPGGLTESCKIDYVAQLRLKILVRLHSWMCAATSLQSTYV